MTATKTTMKFSEIKTAKNIRKALGDITSLAQDITKNGLQDALVVASDGVLIRGHRRVAALKIIRSLAESNGESPLPFEDVPVEIRDIEKDEDRICLQLMDRGECRKNLTSWEISCALFELKKTGLSFEEIAEKVGYSRTHVQRLVGARSVATEEVCAMFDRGLDPPVTLLYELIRVEESKQILEVKKWLEPTKQRLRRKRQDHPRTEEDEGLTHNGRTLRRTGPKHLLKLLTDLKKLGPTEKTAINLIRYLLGQTDRRPVPSPRDQRRMRSTMHTQAA